MEQPDPNRITYFAATDSRGKKVPFGLKARDRERHMYVVGKTGMGKSTLLENMAIQDIQNGEGLGFIDPHGSAVEDLLNYVPAHRMKDVVYFAPFDLDNPIAFNVMEDVGYDKRHLVVSGLMATFKKIWQDAWSARMEYILSNTLLALLEYPDATLLAVNRMYTDKAYRKKVVDNVKDPVVKDFWTKEFANYGDRYTQEATPAIQNKIGQFTSNPLIRNIIGQPKSSFDIRDIMDNKKILFMNLSKGLVGETNMRLLGSMLTTRIFLGAMSRADLPPSELNAAPPFYFYVDEFQNFANESFSEILSEARKYHLNLIIAHQYVAQMEEEVQAAVFGNVGTSVSFRVGPLDAELLEKVFTPKFTAEDLVNLGFAQIYLSLMIDGVGSPPFSAVTIPHIEAPVPSLKEQVIQASRDQYANKRDAIEKAIFDELTSTEGENGPPEPPPRKYPPKNAGNGSGASGNGNENGNGNGNGASGRAAPRRDDTQRNEVVRRPPAPRREDSPRRDDQPRPEPAPRREVVSERASPVVLPTVSFSSLPDRPPVRTSEDLKAILRTMSAAGNKEQKEKVISTALPLRNALADVLKNSGAHEAAPAATPKPATQNAAPVQPKNASDSRDNRPAPFEVPEETLRAIFSEQK
jgi:hypothetical protein